MNVARRRATSAQTDEGQRHAHEPMEGIKYLRSVFGESPEGVCVVDASSRVVVWNRSAAAITGYEASEMEGRLCALEGTTSKLQPFGQAQPSRRRALGKSPPASVCDFCIEKKSRDGTWLNLTAKLIPLRHTDVASLILISRNSRSSLDLRNRLDSSIARSSPGICRDLPATCLLALTSREHEILDLLAAGQTAKPIAAVLSLAIPTVRTHIQNLLRKLEVHSCLEAVTRYLRMWKERP